MRLNLVVGMALAGSALVALLAPAAGTFAAQDGFSGRIADCTACHNRPLPVEPAALLLEGIPATYEPGASYELAIAVTGGPPAMPAPAPQGGFELEAEAGVLLEPAGMEDLLRLPSPRVATYEPAGTLVRSWRVTWTAPDLAVEPRPVRFWAAGLSSNGDHVIALNASVLGERFDSGATATAVALPSEAAVAAWRDLPLRPPTITRVDAGPASHVEGAMEDRNATLLRHRLAGQPWNDLPTQGAWRLRYDGVPPGHHVLQLQAVGANRTSPVVQVPLAVADGNGHVPAQEAPLAAGWLLVPFVLAAISLRRNRP